VAFEKVLDEAHVTTAMRVISYCLMPNHWDLVLWPARDGRTSR
jgi:putative transposase